MTDTRPFPLPGLLMALATGSVLYASGVSAWITGLALVVWIGTLWLPAPLRPPPPAPPQPHGVQLTASAIGELLEHSIQPALILDGDRIDVANAAAREVLGAHVLGQDARVAFRHPEAVQLLASHQAGRASAQGLTGPRSNWQITLQPIDARFALIELVNRTTEGDVSRAHTDFVANASHELRTPLASIIGYMETLVEQGAKADPKHAARFHATVLREARRLQSLVHDLMSLSRIEAEKHDQPRTPVDLALVVPQAARDGAGAERHDRLELKLPRGKFMVRGDHQQLEQLVRNLVDNALKYGAPDGMVTLSIRRQRGWAVVSVQDHGDGIAPEHIPHLTRRFYRTDPGRSRGAGGTGLGLAIVKHIVERHRGQLDIASTQGEGTTVSVRLPLIAAPAEA